MLVLPLVLVLTMVLVLVLQAILELAQRDNAFDEFSCSGSEHWGRHAHQVNKQEDHTLLCREISKSEPQILVFEPSFDENPPAAAATAPSVFFFFFFLWATFAINK